MDGQRLVAMTTATRRPAETHWADEVHALFAAHRIDLIAHVPDGGLQRLIERCQADPAMRSVPLTTEEEGIALAAGAFLGGRRTALLMQSSGVGNCLNLLALPRLCTMPLLMLVSMRGEWGEFNPWQVPMGQSTPALLTTAGVIVQRADRAAEVGPTVEAAIGLAFASRSRVAVLLAQRLIGAKSFVEGGQ